MDNSVDFCFSERDKYEYFLMNFLERIYPHCILAEQVIIAYLNTFEELNKIDVLNFLVALQKKKKIVISKDGWILTRGCYDLLTNDKFYNNVNFNSKTYGTEIDIDYLLNKFDENFKNYIDDLWMVVYKMPESQNFEICKEPWDISWYQRVYEYDDDGNFIENDTVKYKMYQIVRLKSEDFKFKCELLKQSKRSIVKDEVFRSEIARIAIVDNEIYADLVPYVGFSSICIINEKSEDGFDVIAQRDEEIAWNYFDKEMINE